MAGESSAHDAGVFERLGLYDPGDVEAERRLALLRDLVALGATPDDLVEAGGELTALAFDLVARPGRERLTLCDLARRADVTEERVLAVWQAAGFPRPMSDARAFTEADVELMQLVDAARALFGENTTLQLVRVTGSAMARVADAVISAFVVDLGAQSLADDPSGINLVRANIDTLAMLPQFTAAIDTLLRHHLEGLRRASISPGPSGSYETQHLAVGFSDIVDSSGLAQHLSMTELGALLQRFETRAADTITSRGGRVIKLIGDEVMFVAPDAALACHIALELVSAFHDDPRIRSLRGGIAVGEVLVRDGDYFGPVVNLAARLAQIAPANAVLVSESVGAGIGETGTDLHRSPSEQRSLKGFDEPQTVYRVSRP